MVPLSVTYFHKLCLCLFCLNTWRTFSYLNSLEQKVNYMIYSVRVRTSYIVSLLIKLILQFLFLPPHQVLHLLLLLLIFKQTYRPKIIFCQSYDSLWSQFVNCKNGKMSASTNILAPTSHVVVDNISINIKG